MGVSCGTVACYVHEAKMSRARGGFPALAADRSEPEAGSTDGCERAERGWEAAIARAWWWARGRQ